VVPTGTSADENPQQSFEPPGSLPGGFFLAVPGKRDGDQGALTESAIYHERSPHRLDPLTHELQPEVIFRGGRSGIESHTVVDYDEAHRCFILTNLDANLAPT
jgi:hypothetical protein